MLPEFGTPLFYLFSAGALIGPYLLTLSLYVYHFAFRGKAGSMRKLSDAPKSAHSTDWQTSIVRPEGISAVVFYYMFSGLVLSYGFGINVIPPAMHEWTDLPKLYVVFSYFFVFDSLMWMIHWTQHNFEWLYRNTHSVHHTIHSPSILVALTGYLPDTCLLIIVPLHLTLFIVPGNFQSIVVFASLSLIHLHLIHSEFKHPWDPWLKKLGIVNTMDHHVHHLRPKRNLAHFFTVIDRVMGTYVDPTSLKTLVH
jgi:sterol desaturase/sphingolipid hydroxylase (fatty acid hydroxylase superfamily)